MSHVAFLHQQYFFINILAVISYLINVHYRLLVELKRIGVLIGLIQQHRILLYFVFNFFQIDQSTFIVDKQVTADYTLQSNRYIHKILSTLRQISNFHVVLVKYL